MDPRDGVLRRWCDLIPDAIKPLAREPERYRQAGGREFLMIEGIWYVLKRACVPAPEILRCREPDGTERMRTRTYNGVDIVTGKVVSDGTYRVKDKQANSGEIRRFGLRAAEHPPRAPSRRSFQT
ncbi:MAG: hypothetical protein HXY22_12390 [Alphaproteobacteria bacterium]|nr:hypothetical protein [Alphaproteobacteria bacterium]